MASEPQSVVDVIHRAIRDAHELVRDEIALAKAEAREEISRLTRAITLVAGAAASGVMGLVFLLTAVAWAVSEELEWPVWSGFLIVAVTMLILAGVLAAAGRARVRRTQRMPLTVETLKENAEWMRAHTP
jgi:uncharacterized membrane protein YqjE